LDSVMVIKVEIEEIKHKVKLGQKLSQERFDMIIDHLKKRGTDLDKETIEKMREVRPNYFF